MVRLTGPLHSDSASGRIGGRLTFSMRKGRAYARFQNAQADAGTDAQLAVRAIFIAAKNAWLALTDEEKAVYNKKAKYTPMTGYALFIKQFNATPPPLPFTPILLYKMNDNEASTVVIDSGTSANDATASFDTADQSVAGRVDLGFLFSGPTLVVSNGNTGISGADPRSFVIWIKTTFTPSASRSMILEFGDPSGTHTDQQLMLSDDGTLYLANNFDDFTSFGSAVNDGNWHQIVITYDGTIQKAYFDNALVASQVITLATVATPLYLSGALHGTDALEATLDIFALYDFALSEAQIDVLWNGGAGTES